MFKENRFKKMIKAPVHILYHVVLIALSASIVISLPYTADLIARRFLTFWAFSGDEKIFLAGVEISLAVTLILFFNYIARSWKDRRLSRIAAEAGLVHISSAGGLFAKKKNRRLKESKGLARDIMLIGSTGFGTFADEKSDLHEVVRNCREAKIMLLNPYSEGAAVRVKGIMSPDITLERFREQIGNSIGFLKTLRAAQKNIRLKLYDEVPFLKMVISGDYIWVKHYHTGYDAHFLPEYVFRYNQNPGSLYVPFYQHFLNWWNDPRIPEYDLESDDLIYRDAAGNKEIRKRFGGEAQRVA
jgi:hypothetical protein